MIAPAMNRKGFATAAAVTHIKIALFYILVFQFGRFVAAPIKDGGLYLMVACLIEIASVAIVAKIGQGKRVAKDINLLNILAFLVHLIAIPGFYFGVNSDYHNNTIWVIFYVGIARLCYFGKTNLDKLDRLFDYTIGKIAFLRQHYATCLFYGAGLPLGFIILKTNDISIGITAIAAMAFIFIMAASAGEKQGTGTAEVRERAQTMAQALAAINPDAHPLVGMVVHYFTRISPAIKAVDKPQEMAMDERRTAALDNLHAIMQQVTAMKADDRLHFDTAGRINSQLGLVFSGRILATQVAPLVETVNQVMPFELADKTLLLACDLLIDAWFKVAFSNHEFEENAEWLAKLTDLTTAFIKKFRPHVDYTGEGIES